MTDRTSTSTDPALATYAPAVPAPASAGAQPRLEVTTETGGDQGTGTTHIAVRSGAATTAAPTASAATAPIQAVTGATGGESQLGTSPLRTWAAETVGKTLASVDLPTTEQITENLAAVRDSSLLHEAKQLPLSRTGAAAVEHVEQLLASTEDLVAAKSKHDEVQEMLRHGALAAQKVKESSAISESIAKTFGEATTAAAEDTASIASRESTTSSATTLAQQFMHKMFDVTRRLVASAEFRSLLQDIASTVGDFLSASALSQLHGAAGAIQEGETDDDKKARAEAERAQDKAAQVKDAVANLKEPAQRLLARVRDQPEFQAGIRDVIDLFALVRDRAMLLAEQQKQGAQAAAESVAENVAETAEDREVQYHAEQAAEKAQQLIANFGGTLDPLRDATHRLLDALNKKRPEVDALIDEMREWTSEPGDEGKAQAVYDRVRHVLALVKPEAAVQVSQYAEGTVLPALAQAKETVKDVAEQVKEKAPVQLPEQVAPYVRDAAEGAVETAEAAEGEWHTVTHKKGNKGRKQAVQEQEQRQETKEATKDLPGVGAWTEQDEQDARELRTAFEQVAKEARTFLDSLRSDATVRNVEASLTALMHDLFLDDKGAPQRESRLARRPAKGAALGRAPPGHGAGRAHRLWRPGPRLDLGQCRARLRAGAGQRQPGD
ncbi:hypothetical protein AMAG_20029 [Allomyces macrogynus ATCC 38327]|uniref:Uncharacterized protein n=1 Tax=Allomyces macrogynus (strain ATCC 38327) TaxID=578462 RepID=A0A0L0T4I5_ALLM3|nr:hypothetical protein AMAG_20029 [Allomyces macrogynus ATCC 38327]|eukprot:KNE69728.1 hypothetical protein AMAG_20029 [Allomyces macrogynus ATCC 38327]